MPLDVAPLPNRFRLTPDGEVVAVRATAKSADRGGRGLVAATRGIVRTVDTLPAEDAVLVVRTLDPTFAPLLPTARARRRDRQRAVASRVLARELGIPTVVGVDGTAPALPTRYRRRRRRPHRRGLLRLERRVRGMSARRIGYLAALLTVAASGYYFFLYLTRWEWSHAFTAGVIFLAAEVALFGALVLDRIGSLRASMAPAPPVPAQSRGQVLMRIRESAPAHRNHFAWLRADGTGVFVPVLLGAGVIVSGIAWLVERTARAIGGRQLEHGLAVRLHNLAPPADGLIPRDAAPFQLFTPRSRS